jgi:hypothetical protein
MSGNICTSSCDQCSNKCVMTAGHEFGAMLGAHKCKKHGG